MKDLSTWLAMGGYYMYVWPAYGIATLIFAGLILSCHRQQKKTAQQLKQWFKRQAG